MKLPLLCFAIAVSLYACSRDDPAAGQTVGKTRVPARIDEARQAERAADAGKPLSDASLTQIVKAALESESSLDARRIDVENRNGVVALHGAVDTDDQREKAGRIVAAVGGVRNVVNNLTVDPSATTGGTAARKD
jgi:osmotically-inducible protein OsmY